MKLNRIQKGLISEMKSNLAKYKDQARQAIGGLCAEDFDILLVIDVIDAYNDYEVLKSEVEVYVPVELASDENGLYDYISNVLNMKPLGLSYQIKKVEDYVIKHSEINLSYDSCFTYCPTTYIVGFDLQVEVLVKSLHDIEAFDLFCEKEIDNHEYYGVALTSYFYKLTYDSMFTNNFGNSYKYNDVINIINNVKEYLDNIYGNHLNYPRVLNQILEQAYKIAELASKEGITLETATYFVINYVIKFMGNPLVDQQYWNLSDVIEAGWPQDAKQLQLALTNAWQTEAQSKSLWAYHNPKCSQRYSEVAYYPEYNWFDWVLNPYNYYSDNKHFYIGRDVSHLTKLLANNRLRDFKCSNEVNRFNPFVTFKALGLAKYLPAGTLLPRGFTNDLTSFNNKIIKGFKVVKSFEYDTHDYTVMLNAMLLSNYLGTAVKFMEYQDVNYFAQHAKAIIETPEFRPNIETLNAIPEKYKAQIARSRDLLVALFITELKVDWSVSNSPRKAIINSIATKYNVNLKIAEDILNNPSIAETLKYAASNPNEHVVDLMPDLVLEDSGLVLEKMSKTDIRNLYIGDITSCCQHLGGAGEDVCIEGWVDSHSSNYTFRQNTTILAHFWCFETKCGGLMIDSVEGLRQASPEVIARLIKQFAITVKKPVYLSNTNYGLTADVRRCLVLVDNPNVLKSVTSYSYTDYSKAGFKSFIVDVA